MSTAVKGDMIEHLNLDLKKGKEVDHDWNRRKNEKKRQVDYFYSKRRRKPYKAKIEECWLTKRDPVDDDKELSRVYG